ncbi:hypothetical protein E1I18_02945 [Mycoplasmopsis mucosicanis]|uniref:Lipoprotein n=1 Tax=Mycoplasmopsis mucosicanis TaxID=458208 RepID=A0A507SKB4_9BACT|nr:hypothetical protein [Mycoplasmopsis mucosicanis]TQC51376.1 hypothetical protein E1I18_02945 [Mycoplasmopsis mucosicanis]
MRKKWLLSLSTLTAAMPFLAVACFNDAKHQKEVESSDKKNKKIIDKTKKALESKEKNNKLLAHEIEILKSQNHASEQKRENLEQQNEKLQQEIDALKQQIEQFKGKQVKKSTLSARKFAEELKKFITEDIPSALQQQQPEIFARDQSLIEQITKSVDATFEDYEKLNENVENMWNWQQLILPLISRAYVLLNYTSNNGVPVTITKPKSAVFDLLFDWRINDLQRIIEGIEANPDSLYDEKGKNTKTQKLNLLHEIKNTYQDLKNSSSLFMHQISNWAELESEAGAKQLFIKTGSTHQREVLPSFHLPNFRISPFPIYQTIEDEEFITKVKDEFLKLNIEYQQWLSSAKKYISSVRFKETFDEVIKVTKVIYSSLIDPNNLKYANDFNTYKEFEKFVDDARSLLKKVKLINPSLEKNVIDKEVDYEFDKTKDGFAKRFEEEFKPKSMKNDKEAQYLYEDFYEYYSKFIDRVFRSPKATFVQSYDRYALYLSVKSEIDKSKEIINLAKDLGVEFNDEKIGSQKEKFKKLMDSERKFIDSTTKTLEEFKSIVASLEDNTTVSSVEQAKTIIKNLVEKSTNAKEKIIKNLTENTNWNSLFEEDQIKKIQELFNKHSELTKSISSDENNLEKLKGSITKINKSAHDINDEIFAKPNSITADLYQTIEDSRQSIKRYERKLAALSETSSIIPAQEVIVLLRYWQNILKPVKDQLMFKENHPDRFLSAYFIKTFKELEKDYRFKEITGVKADEKNWDIESEGTSITPQSLLAELKALEQEYGKALFDFMKSKASPQYPRIKEALKQNVLVAKEKYYNWLKGLKARGVTLPNKFIWFGSGSYLYPNGFDQPLKWVASNLLKYYAQVYANTELLVKIGTGNFYNK